MATSAPDFFSEQVRDARRFYLDLAVRSREPLTVVCGGRESCLPEYEVDRLDFPYYSLEIVTSGKGTLALSQGLFQLWSGIAYVYGPGVAHRITSDPEEPLEKCFVDFCGESAVRLLDNINFQPGTILRVQNPALIERAFDDLILHGSRSSGTRSFLCDTLLQYILVLVSTSAVSPEEGPSPAYASYLRGRSYIEENYLTLKGLEDAASGSRFDKTYLCRLFHRYDSQTPHEMLTRLKVNKAAELLDHTDLLVKQVAESVGFADPFHFSRVFKRVLGVSPREFRELRRSRTQPLS